MLGVRVYTDGSGLALGGPAGIAYVAIIEALVIEGSLELAAATNQQAEILAAAYGLEEIEACPLATVFSDSQYVVKGMNEWLLGWVRDDWCTSAGSPVKNQEHWHRLLAAVARHEEVRFEWLRGHNGHAWNERADILAGRARIRAGRIAINRGWPTLNEKVAARG